MVLELTPQCVTDLEAGAGPSSAFRKRDGATYMEFPEPQPHSHALECTLTPKYAFRKNAIARCLRPRYCVALCGLE